MLRNLKSRSRLVLTVGTFVLAVTFTSFAQDFGFQSKQAKEAQSQYQNKLTEIKKAATTQSAQAKKDYILALTDAQKSAQIDDLDEAVRIRNAVKQLNDEENEKATDPKLTQAEATKARRKLESRLAGTSWNESPPGNIWTFNADGTLSMTDGRVGKWAAISGTTILTLCTNGYVDRFEFDENLTTISNLHGKLGDPWKAKRAN